MIRTLLAVIATTGMIGSVQALDQTFEVGALSPTVEERTDFFSHPAYSFEDILRFNVGTRFRTINAGAVRYTRDGIDSGLARVANLKLALFAPSDTVGSTPGAVSSMDGARIDLKAVLQLGDFSARVAETAAGHGGGEFLLSVAAVPEPSGWAMVLCGLVVVAFIARRKTSLGEG